MATEKNAIYFFGHNWHDLERLVTLASFHFLTDELYNMDAAGNNTARIGYITQFFRGAALDWAQTRVTDNNVALYIQACRAHFGVVAETTTILQRSELEQLRYGNDVPSFFAEFDRLCLALSITADDSKIVMVRERLPVKVKVLLAEQALTFYSYDTMRTRLITMWALDPHRNSQGGLQQQAPTRPTCGNCGKKGHTAPNCRGKAKN